MFGNGERQKDKSFNSNKPSNNNNNNARRSEEVKTSSSEQPSLASIQQHQTNKKLVKQETTNGNVERRSSPTTNTVSSSGAGSGSRLEFEPDEKEQFLGNNKNKNKNKNNRKSKKRKAKLAKSETIDDYDSTTEDSHNHKASCLMRMVMKKRVLIPLVIISCLAAIYCIPYVEIHPEIPKRVPKVAFDFDSGPLKAIDVDTIKAELLFKGQIKGAESVAIDSTGNMYMAIQGGFILYAHINRSSPIKRSYYVDQTLPNLQAEPSSSDNNLVKIAELNGIKQLPYEYRRRARQGSASSNSDQQSAVSWRRDCTLDEKLYGPTLYSGGSSSSLSGLNEINSNDANQNPHKFVTHVHLSRCSVPLGIRLSADENYLYVVDTMSGLYRVNLRLSERPNSSQRLVTKLLDFGTTSNKRHLVPIQSFDQDELEAQDPALVRGQTVYMNITLKAVDDLVIETGTGHRGADVIYFSDASQKWLTHQFIYDMLEGRASGMVLRFDTGNQQLSIMNPKRVAHVRTSSDDLTSLPSSATNISYSTGAANFFPGIGAPRLDENDIFDDRPLYFTNGLELTDDRKALLIVDTTNKRIIKHFIGGPRKGSTDHWAWTPHFPDNIRRGYDKRYETYWVVGCGQDMRDKFDLLDYLNGWPMLRKFLLKNVYLFGWIVEFLGTHILHSDTVRDFGYDVKIGHKLLEDLCDGMMILQYNRHGDIIRSIHSKQFPNDLVYFSQVSEVIDAKNQEHLLYLSSPAYDYVTKLTLPTERLDVSLKEFTTTTTTTTST